MNIFKIAAKVAALFSLVLFSSSVSAQTDTTVGSLQIGSWVGNPSQAAVAHKDKFGQSSKYALRQNNQGTTFLNSAKGKHLHLRIANKNALSIDPNRKVGIGIQDPMAELDVAGQVQATGGFQIPGTISPGILPTSKGFVFHGATGWIGRRDFVNFNFFDMQVNIGLVQKYLPGYTLVVDGKAMVEDIEVQNSDNWPDFVFEKDYKLTSLRDLEAYVRTNKHLPEIPSASQVIEGVSVGEMQKGLLLKVEEMTLYLIEMEKEITELKNRLAEIE